MIGNDGLPDDRMSFTVIGLGSMGKRRIRCLQALGYTKICGVDLREDRRKEAEELYGICTAETLLGCPSSDTWFICTPPDKHLGYMTIACSNKTMAFVEHGILSTGMRHLNPAYIRPSCTMLYHPEIIKLKKKIASLKISNVIYHCGQHLKDWHPNENIEDFYVSKRETGGAREIVPFELTWMVDLFGVPGVAGMKANTANIADIDDTYNVLLDWGAFLGVLSVDVVSRPAIRRLMVTTSSGSFTIDLNAGIGEDMYVREVAAFLDGTLPNTLGRDMEVLDLLADIEGRPTEQWKIDSEFLITKDR